MNSEWLQHTILWATSLLAPGDRRAEWLKEWQSELWYIPRRGATRFCMGAFRDALCLRRGTGERGIHPKSPLSCLALMVTFAAVSVFIAVRVTALHQEPLSGLRARDLPGACTTMLLFSCLLLPGTLAVWRAPTNPSSMTWQSRLRRGMFLAMKIALVQPTILCGVVVQILMGQLGGFLALGFDAVFILALRWVITDQQQRCPVCLRLLTNRVRIGTPSHTFLEWYGSESTCSRGHGLLHVSEVTATYSPKAQWLCLDTSWNGLFSRARR